jgi:DNA-binding NarL/FixJ family response regulator
MGRSVRARGPTALERWPLVGRSAEFAFARERIVEGRSVVIAGDAGVGKTRLAREVIASAGAEGQRTEWALATQAARSIPFGALAHLVSRDAVGGGRDATLRAVVEALRQHDGRLLLGIDDAHLLDGGSAVLVHQLVAREIASAVLTVRSGEPVPDPILALWKDDLAARVELQPLSRAEVAELLGSVLGGPVNGATLHALEQRTAGNVLFLRELVLQGLDRGVLRAHDGLWHWDGSLDPGRRLRDLVAARLGSLDDVEHDTLEVLAVGEPVPLASLRDLVPVTVVARLERRGLVGSRTEGGEVQVRLAHPLFGEVVRADTPAVRFDDVRRRLADAFQTRDDLMGEDTLRVAMWRAESGDGSDPKVLVDGARRAWGVGEVGLAERLARLALAAGPDFEAGRLLGEALADEGRFEEAVETWRAVEDLPASDRQRAAFATGFGGILLWTLGRPDEAVDLVQRTASRVVDPGARDDLDAFHALLRAIAADSSSEADDAASAVLERPVLWGRARARGALAAVVARTAAGRLEEAIRVSDAAIEGVGRTPFGASPKSPEEFPALQLLLRLTKARALSFAGRLGQAESVTSSAYTHALEHGDDMSRARCCLMSGVIALLRGHARSAVAQLQEAEVVLRGHEDGFLRGVLVYLGMAFALLGELELAQGAVERAQGSNASMAGFWDVDLARARAWVCLARGERSAAIQHLVEASRTAERGEQLLFEAFALHDLARLGPPHSAIDRLGELASTADGALVRAMATHATGLARSDAKTLDAASINFGDLGFDLYAAEASAAAAAAHRANGRRSSAAASANRARALLGACAGVHTPALRWLDEDDELTVREREVATLAARGLTNQQIADRLFVSVRTVHAHLRSAYAKLGVSSRGELGTVLGI